MLNHPTLASRVSLANTLATLFATHQSWGCCCRGYAAARVTSAVNGLVLNELVMQLQHGGAYAVMIM